MGGPVAARPSQVETHTCRLRIMEKPGHPLWLKVAIWNGFDTTCGAGSRPARFGQKWPFVTNRIWPIHYGLDWIK